MDCRPLSGFLCGLCGFAGDDFTQRHKGRRVLVLAAILFFTVAHTHAQANLDDLRNKIISGSAEDKRNALLAIRNLKTEEASRIGVPALKDTNELVRASAAIAVVWLPGGEAAANIIPLLSDKSEFVRVEAAFALNELGQIVDALRAAGGLTDPAIGQVVVPALIRTLGHDKSVRVRAAAAAALGRASYSSGINALTAILKIKPSEEKEYLRRSAARSIGQVVQIVRWGKHEIATPQNFLPDKYIVYPRSESTMVSWPPDTVDILLNVLQNPKEADDTRREAAFALGNFSERAAVPLLRSYLNSPDEYLAEICKEALMKIEGRR